MNKGVHVHQIRGTNVLCCLRREGEIERDEA